MNEFFHPDSRGYSPISTTRLTEINEKEDATLSGLTDLQANIAAQAAAITALQNEQTMFLADIKAALANTDSDAAVEAGRNLSRSRPPRSRRRPPLRWPLTRRPRLPPRLPDALHHGRPGRLSSDRQPGRLSRVPDGAAFR